MSSLRLWRARPSPRARVDSEHRIDLRWGLVSLGAALLLVVVIGVVYVRGITPERTYSADLTQTGGLRPGDDVRIAGIPVGTVKSITLRSDRVRMNFTVSSDVFVGDLTTLDIRMLTIVGGYYLAVETAGSKSLGTAVIPSDRVIIPYNLTQAFQDAVQPVQKMDGIVVRQDWAAVGSALTASPDSLHAAIQAAGDLVAVIDKQSKDISDTLAMADDYLTALDDNADVLRKLLNTLGTLEALVARDKAAEHQALDDLATVLHDFSPLGRAWDRSLQQKVQPLADAMPKLEELGKGLDALLDSIRTLVQRLSAFLPAEGGVSVDQSAATITDVCVPIPGGGC